MIKSIFFYIPLLLFSCTANKAAVHPGHYWDKKWQATTQEFKPNPFAQENGFKVVAIDIFEQALKDLKAANESIVTERQNLENLNLLVAMVST